MPYISSLHIYPIKSCAGQELQKASLDSRGIYLDRSWVIINKMGKIITQREVPALSTVQPILNDSDLSISAPNMEALSVSCQITGTTHEVDIWGDICQGIDQGNEAADWFSTFLGNSSRLLFFNPNFVRSVDPCYASGSEDQVGFADSFPILIISEGSLADLNARLAKSVQMNRFRPNIVVADCPPYAEDKWKKIQIGDVDLDIVKPCGRCSTILVEQETGLSDKEPLRTLAKYRIFEGPSPTFGQNALHHDPGCFQRGMAVKILDIHE